MSGEELVAKNPVVANTITGFVRAMAAFMMAYFIPYASMVATSYRRGEGGPGSSPGPIPPPSWASHRSRPSTAAGQNGEFGRAAPGIAIVMLLILLGILLPFRRFLPKGSRRSWMSLPESD